MKFWVGAGAVAMAAACSQSDESASPVATAPTATSGRDGGAPSPDATVVIADAAPGVDAPPVGRGIYDSDGPVPYNTNVESVTMEGGGSFNVTVYMPTTPGPHPVVSFSCGSTQTAAGYVPYGKRLASHGIAMVLRDDPGALTPTTEIVPGAEYVVAKWLPAAHGSQLDLTRVGLGGHSRGGGVSLLAAERGLKGKVAAWFGLDPVDNQFLISPGLFARTELPQIGIATAYLGAEVESNCAPAADSYPMLFPKSPSPSTLILGKGAGHTQLEVPEACAACSLCSPSGTRPNDLVLAYSVRYFAAFFARELLKDGSVGAKFEGAGGPSDTAAGLIELTVK
jgi:hypothetical protein